MEVLQDLPKVWKIVEIFTRWLAAFSCAKLHRIPWRFCRTSQKFGR